MMLIEQVNTIEAVEAETTRRAELCSENRRKAQELAPIATEIIKRVGDREHPEYKAVIEEWRRLNREHDKLKADFDESLFVLHYLYDFYGVPD